MKDAAIVTLAMVGFMIMAKVVDRLTTSIADKLTKSTSRTDGAIMEDE